MEAARTLNDVSGVGLQLPGSKWNTVGRRLVHRRDVPVHQVRRDRRPQQPGRGGLTDEDGKTAELTPAS